MNNLVLLGQPYLLWRIPGVIDGTEETKLLLDLLWQWLADHCLLCGFWVEPEVLRHSFCVGSNKHICRSGDLEEE